MALGTLDQLILDEYNSPQVKYYNQEDMITEMKKRFLSSKRKILRMFRLRVRRQKKIKCFYLRIYKKIRYNLKIDVIKTWRKYIDVVKRGRMLSLWTKRNNILAPSFDSWKMQEKREKKGQYLVQNRLNIRALDCLRFLQYLVWNSKKKSLKIFKKRGTILCFFVSRIFRAWKMFTKNRKLNPLQEAGNIVRAIKFIKKRIFLAWHEHTEERIEDNKIIDNRIIKRKQLITKIYVFSELKNIKLTVTYSRYTIYKKVLQKLAKFAFFRRKFIRSLKLGMIRGKVFRVKRVFRILKSLVRSKKKINRLIRTVVNRKENNLCCLSFSVWVAIYKSSLAARTSDTVRTVSLRNSRDNNPHTGRVNNINDMNYDLAVRKSFVIMRGSDRGSDNDDDNDDNSDSDRDNGVTSYHMKKSNNKYSKPPLPLTTSSSSSSSSFERGKGGGGGGVGMGPMSTPGSRSIPGIGSRSITGIGSRSITGIGSRSIPGIGSRSIPGIVSRSPLQEEVSERKKDRGRMAIVESVLDRHNQNNSSSTQGNIIQQRLQALRVKEIKQNDLNLSDEEEEEEDEVYFDKKITNYHLSRLFRYRILRVLRIWHVRTIKLIQLQKKYNELKICLNNNLVRKSFLIAASYWTRSSRSRIKNMYALHHSSSALGMQSSGSGTGSKSSSGSSSRSDYGGIHNKSM